MPGKIEKYELCASCRKIGPVKEDGSQDNSNSIENILDSKGYNHPVSRNMLNMSILTLLEKNGGCPACINLVKSVL